MSDDVTVMEAGNQATAEDNTKSGYILYERSKIYTAVSYSGISSYQLRRHRTSLYSSSTVGSSCCSSVAAVMRPVPPVDQRRFDFSSYTEFDHDTGLQYTVMSLCQQ